MSKLEATIKRIDECGDLHIVEFECCGHIMEMMSLELDDRLKPNSRVLLSLKPTQIGISRSFFSYLSFTNQLPVSIKELEEGKLLTYIKMEFCGRIIESIITKKAYKNLELKKGDKAVALINASELSISEIL